MMTVGSQDPAGDRAAVVASSVSIAPSRRRSSAERAIVRWVRSAHHQHIVPRRVDRLAAQIAPLLPEGARVLDLGAGTGAIAQAIMQRRPDLECIALEVKVRSDALIPLVAYDGRSIPFDDCTFDCVLLIDVVHHAWEPVHLLAEARRVCKKRIVLKDHLADAVAAPAILSFMDWISNARYGIAMPYTYWTRQEWAQMLTSADLGVESWCGHLHLYPRPASWVFDASLQFLASLTAVSPTE
jgi:SAM-dependent methyltransferase